MDPNLLTALRIHNPWLDEPAGQGDLLRKTLPASFIPRTRRLDLKPGRAEVVIGPRQAGKSTWIRESILRKGEPLLILHAEEPAIREIGRSPATALDHLVGILRPETIVMIEEAQHLENASLLIKGWIDLEPERRLVATGSSSFMLRSKNRESLAGRARRTLLLPFSLTEASSVVSTDLVPAIRDARLAELWEEMTVTGGYPEARLGDDPEQTLYHLIEAFVLRDAADLENLERPAVFRKLLELAAADTGNLINQAQWASIAQAARSTVGRYLDIAQEAHILRLIPPFVGGKRAEITGSPKVYFLDNGLRNAVFGGFQPSTRRVDRGALWETALYSELLKHLSLLDEVLFWRSKNGAEVDFVVRRPGQEMIAVEVKASPLRRPTISRSARSFIEAYRPHRFVVMNAALREEIKVEDTDVWFRRPWELTEILACEAS